ncbi:hypothetical protein C8J57DRAFT_1296074 [Mycena rebaudengoi]|nr:hypothetical protein C8J57DRAFT_1296074 [Mycena rebaudengoi]
MLAIFAFVLTALVFSANVVAQDDAATQCLEKCATDSLAQSGGCTTMYVLRPLLPTRPASVPPTPTKPPSGRVWPRPLAASLRNNSSRPSLTAAQKPAARAATSLVLLLAARPPPIPAPPPCLAPRPPQAPPGARPPRRPPRPQLARTPPARPPSPVPPQLPSLARPR